MLDNNIDMVKKSIVALWIGEIAHEILGNHEKSVGTINGITSQGIFGLINPDHLLFFAPMGYRGPLTININTSISSGLSINDKFLVTQRGFYFPDQCVEIVTQNARIFSRMNIDIEKIEGITDISTRFNQMLEETHQKKFVETSWINYYFPLERLKSEKVNQDGVFPSKEMEKIIREKLSIPDMFEILDGFLGYGRGLTPSGDDFLSGIFLMNYYHKNGISFPQEIVNRLCVSAKEKTTIISANLLVCAANGLADERILNLVKYILTGEGSDKIVASEVITWGNSSGLDLLAGCGAWLSILKNMEIK